MRETSMYFSTLLKKSFKLNSDKYSSVYYILESIEERAYLKTDVSPKTKFKLLRMINNYIIEKSRKEMNL